MTQLMELRDNADINNIEFGFYSGISNDLYHSSKHLGSSSLKFFTGEGQTPAHHKFNKDHPFKQTPAMLTGTAFHTALLEPELYDLQYTVAPEINKRTNAGKEQWKEFVKNSGHLTVLTKEQNQQVKDMVISAMKMPLVKSLLEPDEGVSESSIFWRDEATGIACKARPDRIWRDKVMLDVKSTQDASPSGFSNSIANFGYDMQMAHYNEGFRQVYKTSPEKYLFIATETKAPYLTAVYAADNIIELNGHYRRENALQRYLECKKADVWGGYPNNIVDISLPYWATNEDLIS